MINFKKFNSVISLTSYFTSDDKCKQAIIESHRGVGKEQDIVSKIWELWKDKLFYLSLEI